MCNVDKRTFWRVLFYESRDGWFKNCGFYHADLGEIRVNGRKLGKDMDMMEDAGIIIEEPAYIRTLSGYKNLDLLYRINHKKTEIK